MLTGLVCFPANLCPPFRSVLFTPSSAVLLTSPCSLPFSSPFQFPLLKWDVVYRGESVHSLSAAPCVVIRWREIGLKWNRGVLPCKHPAPRNAGVLCARQCAGMHIHCGEGLMKITLFLLLCYYSDRCPLPLSASPHSLCLLTFIYVTASFSLMLLFHQSWFRTGALFRTSFSCFHKQKTLPDSRQEEVVPEWRQVLAGARKQESSGPTTSSTPLKKQTNKQKTQKNSRIHKPEGITSTYRSILHSLGVEKTSTSPLFFWINDLIIIYLSNSENRFVFCSCTRALVLKQRTKQPHAALHIEKHPPYKKKIIH